MSLRTLVIGLGPLLIFVSLLGDAIGLGREPGFGLSSSLGRE